MVPRAGIRQQPGGHDALLAVLPPGRGSCRWSCVSPSPLRLPALAHASDFRKEDNESVEKHSYIYDSAADRWQKACTALAKHPAGPGFEGWEGLPAPVTCQLS